MVCIDGAPLTGASPALGSVWQIAQTNQMEYPEARVKPGKNDFNLKDVRFAYPPNDALLSDRPFGRAVLYSHTATPRLKPAF